MVLAQKEEDSRLRERQVEVHGRTRGHVLINLKTRHAEVVKRVLRLVVDLNPELLSGGATDEGWREVVAVGLYFESRSARNVLRAVVVEGEVAELDRLA